MTQRRQSNLPFLAAAIFAALGLAFLGWTIEQRAIHALPPFPSPKTAPAKPPRHTPLNRTAVASLAASLRAAAL